MSRSPYSRPCSCPCPRALRCTRPPHSGAPWFQYRPRWCRKRSRSRRSTNHYRLIRSYPSPNTRASCCQYSGVRPSAYRMPRRSSSRCRSGRRGRSRKSLSPPNTPTRPSPWRRRDTCPDRSARKRARRRPRRRRRARSCSSRRRCRRSPAPRCATRRKSRS